MIVLFIDTNCHYELVLMVISPIEWLAFVATFGYGLRWLTRRPWAGALFGFLGGPLAYSAGAGFGAIEFLEPEWVGRLMVGLYWAFILPVLFAIKQTR